MADGRLPSGFRLLVLQHHPAEHLGRFAPLLAADGARITIVSLTEGDCMPSVGNYDGIWALGGPMQVWQEDSFAWLAAEKASIREAVVERNMPFLGLCLGHQLLAESLGGSVAVAERPEVGVLPVTLTEAGQTCPIFRGMDARLFCIQGHGAEVTALPSDVDVLASSTDCPIQAFAYGERAFGLQFHAELTRDMVDACLEIEAYRSDFEAMLGEDGIVHFRTQVQERSTYFDSVAARLYANWANCAAA